MSPPESPGYPIPLPVHTRVTQLRIVIHNRQPAAGFVGPFHNRVKGYHAGPTTAGMTRLALIAHDEKKPDLIQFVRDHETTFRACELIATGTTGKRLNEATDLAVERMESGPLGGDLMIGAEVAKNALAGVIFLRDPLRAQPHEPDISALLRICDVHDTPLATNLASATHLIEGIDG